MDYRRKNIVKVVRNDGTQSSFNEILKLVKTDHRFDLDVWEDGVTLTIIYRETKKSMSQFKCRLGDYVVVDLDDSLPIVSLYEELLNKKYLLID